MRIKSRMGLLLVLLAVGVLTSALAAGAQGPVGGGQENVRAPAPDTSVLGGIGNPPPAGYSVLYMFTGAANQAAGGRNRATAVHCTNFHASNSVNVRVELYNYFGGTTVWTGYASIASGQSVTFNSQPILAYYSDVILTPAVPHISQGSGRVLVQQHSQVICTAQVLDADVDPPIYVVELDLFKY